MLDSMRRQSLVWLKVVQFTYNYERALCPAFFRSLLKIALHIRGFSISFAAAVYASSVRTKASAQILRQLMHLPIRLRDRRCCRCCFQLVHRMLGLFLIDTRMSPVDNRPRREEDDEAIVVVIAAEDRRCFGSAVLTRDGVASQPRSLAVDLVQPCVSLVETVAMESIGQPSFACLELDRSSTQRHKHDRFRSIHPLTPVEAAATRGHDCKVFTECRMLDVDTVVTPASPAEIEALLPN